MRRDVFEDVTQVFPDSQCVGARHLRPSAVVDGERANEPIAIGRLQWAKDHGVDHREHCGGGADAEAESQDDNGRESRTLGKRSQRVPQILSNVLNPSQVLTVTRDLLHWPRATFVTRAQTQRATARTLSQRTACYRCDT